MTAVKDKKPLKQIFGEINYAWELLQAQVKLETLDAQMITGQDISQLLQLYMRGVQKMNTLIDIRQSFFKNKVTTLMSRPSVIKILNKPMVKKNQPAIVNCSSPQQTKITMNKQQIIQFQSPKKNLDPHKQLQLKEKKQSLEMRLAYSAQQNNPDALKKLIKQHSQKQTILSQKIVKIVDSHEQRLRKRISERKMKTIATKSKCQNLAQDENQGIDSFGQINLGQNKEYRFLKKQNKLQYQNNCQKQIIINQFSLNDNPLTKIFITLGNKVSRSSSIQHKKITIQNKIQQNNKVEKNRKRQLSVNKKINQDIKFNQFIKQKILQKKLQTKQQQQN